MAAWHSGTSHQIVECPMCHVFMNPCVLDDHVATRHSSSVPDNILDPEPEPTPPTINPLHCPICTKVISKNKKKFAKHMKMHTKVICPLCSSIVSMGTFSNHTNECRKSHNAAVTCPLCNEKLPNTKPNKHFKQHVPSLKCPIAPDHSFEYNKFNIHMSTHIQKLVTEQELSYVEHFLKSPHFPNSENSNSIPQTQGVYESSYSQHVFFEKNTNPEDLNRPVQTPNKNPDKSTDKLDVKSRLYALISHQCPICNGSINEGKFESHLQTCLQTQTIPFKCPRCSRKFSDLTTTVRHIHHNHITKLHTCHGCHNTIPCFTIRTHPIQCLSKAPIQLTKQQKIILNSSGKITCPICQKQCKKTQLSSHMLLHAIFQCQSCGWSTEKLCEFTPHLYSCVESSRPSCPFCFNHVSKTRFSEHVLTEHSYLCPICYTAMSKNEFTFHGLLCVVIHNVSVDVPKNMPKTSTNKPKTTPTTPTPSKSTPTPPKSTPTIQSKLKTSYPTNSTAIPTSKFSCPFCQFSEIEDFQLIRSHLLSCEKIQDNSNLHVVNLPDIVGLRIN